MRVFMKTTIDISPPLLKKAQNLARKRGTTFKALVEAGLRVILASPQADADKVVVEPYVFKVEGKSDKTWGQISEVLSQDEQNRFKS